MFAKNKTAMCQNMQQKLQNKSRETHRVLSLLCALIILISQVLPAAAANSGAWVEVCGQSGVYLALIDQDGEKPKSQCKRCPLCLVQSDKLATVPAGGRGIFHPIHFIWVTSSRVTASLPLGREWYWHYSRGPPAASIDIPMTSTAYLVDQNLVGPVSENPWRASWV